MNIKPTSAMAMSFTQYVVKTHCRCVMYLAAKGRIYLCDYLFLGLNLKYEETVMIILREWHFN